MKSTFLLALIMGWGCGDKSETGEPSDEPSSEPSEEINPLDVDDDNDGYTENEGDCDDSDRNTYPGATEYCNNNDDDCDNQVDENGVDGDTWYRDSDGDGYGSSLTVKSCDLPDGYTNNNDDCNDNDSSIHPGATEDLCNDIDENCSGSPDYTTDTSFHIT